MTWVNFNPFTPASTRHGIDVVFMLGIMLRLRGENVKMSSYINIEILTLNRIITYKINLALCKKSLFTPGLLS